MLTTASNSTASTAIRYLKSNAADAASSLAKLSSGSRIVKPSDDAASLAIGTKIKADVTALKTAQTNTSTAQSLLQVADGGMARISDMLLRMKALATQATSGSVSDNERSFINQEYQALNTQIDAVADNTKFNGQTLLNGGSSKVIENAAAGLATRGVSLSLSGNAAAGAGWTLGYDQASATFTLTDTVGSKTYTAEIDNTSLVVDGTVDFAAAGIKVNLTNFDDATDMAAQSFDVTGGGTLEFQVGVTSSEKIAVNISDVNTAVLGTSGTGVTTQTTAQAAGNALDTAISRINTARANTGSLMSRFEFVGANLATQVENLDAARSTLTDVDVADEMSKFSSANVLQQAATAMLAQANQMPQGLLRLLQ
jgi:flagellin